jgi:hypothetical protein
MRGLLARSLYKVSWQDLYTRSLYKLSVSDLCARSLYRSVCEVSWQDLCTRSPKRFQQQKIPRLRHRSTQIPPRDHHETTERPPKDHRYRHNQDPAPPKHHPQAPLRQAPALEIPAVMVKDNKAFRVPMVPMAIQDVASHCSKVYISLAESFPSFPSFPSCL